MSNQPPRHWSREPAHDRRISRGDDFEGDAWRNTVTRAIRWVAINHTPNAPSCAVIAQKEED